jgi:hypothetical protein
LNQPFWGSPIYYGNPHLWRYKNQIQRGSFRHSASSSSWASFSC